MNTNELVLKTADVREYTSGQLAKYESFVSTVYIYKQYPFPFLRVNCSKKQQLIQLTL